MKRVCTRSVRDRIGALSPALGLVGLMALSNCSSDHGILAPYVPRPHMRDMYPAYRDADGSVYYSYTSATQDTIGSLRQLKLQKGEIIHAGVGVFVSFSPDGARRAASNGGVLVITDATTDSTIALFDDARYGRATWSPSGEQIAVDVFLSGANDGVWVVDLPSGARTRLLPAGARWPAWSPTEDELAFVIGDPDAEIAILEFATGRVDTLTDNDENDSLPAYSRDGTMLAWSRASVENAAPRLVVGHVANSAETVLSVRATGPTWTSEAVPRIICSYWESPTNTFKLAAVNLDGLNLTLLVP